MPYLWSKLTHNSSVTINLKIVDKVRMTNFTKRKRYLTKSDVLIRDSLMQISNPRVTLVLSYIKF